MVLPNSYRLLMWEMEMPKLKTAKNTTFICIFLIYFLNELDLCVCSF